MKNIPRGKRDSGFKPEEIAVKGAQRSTVQTTTEGREGIVD